MSRARTRLQPIAVLLIDAAVTAASFWLALLARFEGAISDSYLTTLPAFMLLIVCFRVLSNVLFRLHRWSFRFSGLADGARVAMSGVFGTGLLLGTVYLLRDPGPPRSVVLLELLLSTLGMVAVRFSPRLAGLYMSDWVRSRRDGTVRTVIVGAGAAGELLLRDLQQSPHHSYHVVGFVDDDPSKLGHVVGGRAVLGATADLPRIARDSRLQQVLIAIPRLHGRRIREILSTCGDLKLRFRILPVSYAYLQDRPAAAMMQELSPEDLLPRDPVRLSSDDLPVVLDRRTALVTGAAGSIGSEICAQLLETGLRSLVMVDLDENGLYLLGRRFQAAYPDASVHLEVADIRDAARVDSLMSFYRPNDVFHAAAHKHVPLMEHAPSEAIKNNVLGTRNVAVAADAAGVERFLYVSTDKAVRPTSVMGATKRLGEALIRSMAERSSTRFCAVRFGNVLGSAGSVVPLFRAQIESGGPVTVTHAEVRRYFMTIAEAVSLVLQAAYGDFGTLCVLDMGEQIRIVDLARHMITMAGLVPDVDIPIVFTGLRPGEKLAEELLTEEEERTQRVHRKIVSVDCPSSSGDMRPVLDSLAEAAALSLEPRIVELLRAAVPSYRPARHGADTVAGASRAADAVGRPPAQPPKLRVVREPLP